MAVTGLAALFLAWQIAEEAYALPALALSATLAAILVRLLRLPFDVIILGLVLFGYLVGNRGFAQLMPGPSVPLLPAEAALLVAGGWWLVSAAFARRAPWSQDALSRIVVLWVAVGTVRLLFDVRSHGFLAIRDYAVVYYAFFYFIARRQAEQPSAQRFLVQCLLWGSVLLFPASLLFEAFPEFFLTKLTLHGIPLLFYKGDLIYMFFGVGSLVTFFCTQGRFRQWFGIISVVLFLAVVAGDNRASQLGLVCCWILLLAARRWQYPLLQGAVAALALLAVVTASVLFNSTWADRKLEGTADRLRSLADLGGHMRYTSDESSNKGDNNRFRRVWWGTVLRDTWETNPAFGLGFGADLAQSFVREYNPDISEEFTTRAPHNVFLNIFGRMGFAGLAVWVAFCAALLLRTWHAMRGGDDPVQNGLWGSLWIILVTATFGVVLEGPMGAVPFWIILGLASAETPKGAAAAVPGAAPTASLHGGGGSV